MSAQKVSNLSPLNLSQLIARSRNQPTNDREAKGNEPIEVYRWQCSICHETYDGEDDARECCAAADPDSQACPICGDCHDSHRAAADCCLWKDLDAPSRWRIADAVEAGSTWLEQLGVTA